MQQQTQGLMRADAPLTCCHASPAGKAKVAHIAQVAPDHRQRYVLDEGCQLERACSPGVWKEKLLPVHQRGMQHWRQSRWQSQQRQRLGNWAVQKLYTAGQCNRVPGNQVTPGAVQHHPILEDICRLASGKHMPTGTA